MKKILKKIYYSSLFLILTFFSIKIYAKEFNYDKYFLDLNTFSSDFKQITWQQINNTIKVTSEAKGVVYLKKPNLFRWDYKSPEEMQLLSDGKFFYHYDILLMQVSKKPLEQIDDNRLLWLLNEKKISDIFDIENITKKEIESTIFSNTPNTYLSDIDYIAVKAKGDANTKISDGFKKIILGFDKKNLKYFAAQDELGVVEFYFDNTKMNKTLPKDWFLLDVPTNVDILM